MVRNNPERPVQALFAIGSVVVVTMLLAAFLSPTEDGSEAGKQAVAEAALLEIGAPAEADAQ